MSQYVQTIVVAPTGDHEDVIRTVAHSSVACAAMATEEHEAAWTQWLSGAFTKIVKRTSLAKVERLAAETSGAVVRCGREAVACALPPMLPDERPLLAVKAQVSGLQREHVRLATPPFSHPLSLMMNNTLGMSTGKAAAQAAHATVTAFLSEGMGVDADEFMADISLEFSTPEQMDAALALGVALAVIKDAGRTEIAPGSRTAVVVRR